jgi:hypothetical protein
VRTWIAACAGLAVILAIGVITARDGFASRPPSKTPGGSAALVRRQGTLVMADDNSFYDLDSLAPDWGHVSAEMITGVQDLTYVLKPLPRAKPHLYIYGRVAVLVGGSWTAQACVNAAYRDTLGQADVGYLVHAGQGFCVETFNSDAKTDGCHLALLIVKARTPQSVTLNITVWDIRPPKPSLSIDEWC